MKKCLLVSNEPWYQQGYVDMLKVFSIKTKQVWNVSEASQALQSSKDEYVFILLDAVMFRNDLKTCEQVFSFLEDTGIPYMIEGDMENWPQSISLENFLGRLGNLLSSFAIGMGSKIFGQTAKIEITKGGFKICTEVSDIFSVDLFPKYPFLSVLKERGII
jgi:hypothetical protein